MEKKTRFVYDGLPTGELGITLTDDKISRHLCVANGFDIRHKSITDDSGVLVDFMEPSEQDKNSISRDLVYRKNRD